MGAESAADLDLQATAEVLELLVRLHDQGRTIVMITNFTPEVKTTVHTVDTNASGTFSSQFDVDHALPVTVLGSTAASVSRPSCSSRSSSARGSSACAARSAPPGATSSVEPTNALRATKSGTRRRPGTR